jgi:hypothetical protein
MTGPEHYREAERLLEEYGQLLEEFGQEFEVPVEDRESTIAYLSAAMARAQVHATLALAAATALADYLNSSMTEGDYLAWYQAASAQPEHHRRRREAETAEAAEGQS